jgi:hypothetical protein
MSNRSGNRLCANELVVSFALQHHVCTSEPRLALPALGKQRSEDICAKSDKQNSRLGLGDAAA